MWPGLGDVSYFEGWTSRENDDETRGDLSSLACYWPRKGDDFWVEEEGAVLDEGDEEAGLGAHFAFAAVASLLSGVLLFCAYRRLL